MDQKTIKIIAIGVGAEKTEDQIPLRTCSEICIDIDNIKCIADSLKINNEIFKNRKQYCLVKFKFMQEYHQEKVANSKEILNEIKGLVLGRLKSFHLDENTDPDDNDE